MSIDFPKLESPFEREMVKDKGYICIPKFKPEFKWIFDKSKVIATEKFDGYNVCIIIEDGRVKKVFNRKNPIGILTHKKDCDPIEGINRALARGYFDTNTDGQFFGEMLGPNIQKNNYGFGQFVWLPFEYIKKHYLYKFWYNFVEEVDLDSDEAIYRELRDLFKVLKSRYAIRSGQVPYFAEGIVFHNKVTGEMCKIRRSMFDWFKHKKHNWHV